MWGALVLTLRKLVESLWISSVCGVRQVDFLYHIARGADTFLSMFHKLICVVKETVCDLVVNEIVAQVFEFVKILPEHRILIEADATEEFNPFVQFFVYPYRTIFFGPAVNFFLRNPRAVLINVGVDELVDAGLDGSKHEQDGRTQMSPCNEWVGVFFRMIGPRLTEEVQRIVIHFLLHAHDECTQTNASRMSNCFGAVRPEAEFRRKVVCHCKLVGGITSEVRRRLSPFKESGEKRLEDFDHGHRSDGDEEPGYFRHVVYELLDSFQREDAFALVDWF